MSYIEKRKDGRVFFVAETTIDGKRYRKRYSSQREALKAEKDWKIKAKEAQPRYTPKPSKPTSKTISETIEQAITLLWLTKGIDGKWLTNIRGHLGHFQKWSNDARLDTIDKDMIDRYTVHLIQLRIAPNTSNAHLRTLRSYLKWAHGMGYCGAVPSFTFRRAQGMRTVVFDRDTREKVIAWFKGKAKTSMVAKEAYSEASDFWMVLFRTGMRRDELLLAKPEHMRDQGLWLPKTKNRKERVVPLLPEVRLVLASRLPWSITRPQLHRSLIMCRKALGVYKTDRDFVLHTARHTVATDLVERGADIREVQELLGHSSIVTTSRYVKVTPVRLSKLVELLK